MAEGRDSSRGESGVHERLVARRQADALVGDAEATRDLLVVHARGSVGDAHGEGAVAAQDDALHDVGRRRLPAPSALDWTSGVFAGHRTSSTFGASLAAIHARRFSDVIASPGGSRGGDWSSEASTAAVPRRGARAWTGLRPWVHAVRGDPRSARAHGRCREDARGGRGHAPGRRPRAVARARCARSETIR